MKTCKNSGCANTFPSGRRINGKIQNFANRKYCFVCSPFGKNNRIRLENPTAVQSKRGTVVVCIHCGKEYVFRSRAGMTTDICIACTTRNRRRGIKQKAVDYKGGKCQRCGYDRCLKSLQFHHTDPNVKDFTIANNWGKWESIRNELDKCILLCANCHGEIHYELGSKAEESKPEAATFRI